MLIAVATTLCSLVFCWFFGFRLVTHRMRAFIFLVNETLNKLAVALTSAYVVISFLFRSTLLLSFRPCWKLIDMVLFYNFSFTFTKNNKNIKENTHTRYTMSKTDVQVVLATTKDCCIKFELIGIYVALIDV